MSTAKDFLTGRLTAVYSPAGNDAAGQTRYQRANFDVLEWAPNASDRRTTYVVPLGTNRISSDDLGISPAAEVGREFGYYTLNSLVIEPHTGDGSDSWIGLHSFGPV